MKVILPPPEPAAETRERFRRAMIQQPGIYRVKAVSEAMGIPLGHAKIWERQFRDDIDYAEAMAYAAQEELDRRARLEHRALRAMEMTVAKLENVVRDGTWEKHAVKLANEAERADKAALPIAPMLARIRDQRIAQEARAMESKDRIAAAGKLINAYTAIVNANRSFEDVTVIAMTTPKQVSPAKARELVREIFGTVTPNDETDPAGGNPAGNPTH